ncbi:hypothetical protein GE09DRAFT_500504 [Coniochaeta sp. 2T2.1]|nr:hypothetical protein GE09DRAFT_500504 [Coniochaeta sp. 2T2.1]
MTSLEPWYIWCTCFDATSPQRTASALHTCISRTYGPTMRALICIGKGYDAVGYSPRPRAQLRQDRLGMYHQVGGHHLASAFGDSVVFFVLSPFCGWHQLFWLLCTYLTYSACFSRGLIQLIQRVDLGSPGLEMQPHIRLLWQQYVCGGTRCVVFDMLRAFAAPHPFGHESRLVPGYLGLSDGHQLSGRPRHLQQRHSITGVTQHHRRRTY